MLNGTERTKLRGYHDRLKRWSGAISRSAVAFHEEVEDLLDQAEQALKLGGMFGSSSTVQMVGAAIGRLADVAKDFDTFFPRRVAVEQTLETVITDAAKLPDEAIEQYVKAQRETWRSRLVRCGAYARQPAELVEDRAIIEQVANECQELHEALSLLIEANGLRHDLADDPAHIASLLREFDGWKSRLRQEGPTSSLLSAIEDVLIPLRLRRNRPVDVAPANLGGVQQLMLDAAGWSKALNRKGAYEVERMDDELIRIEAVQDASRLPRLQQLEANVRAFLEEARTEGEAIRDGILARLGDRQRHLRSAIKTNSPDANQLVMEIQELTALTIDSPDSFRDWLQFSATVDQNVANIATSRRPDLVNLLVSKLQAALVSVNEIPLGNLTLQQQTDLALLKTRLTTIEHAAPQYPVEQLFQELSTLGIDVQRIEKLELQGERAMQALKEQHRQVSDRYEVLRSAASSAGAGVPDLAADLAAAIDGTASLDLAGGRLKEIEETITSSSEAFIRQCTLEVDNLTAKSLDQSGIVAYLTESTAISLPKLAVASGDGPTKAAATLLEARSHHESVAAMVRTEVERLFERLSQSIADTSDWLAVSDALAPGDHAAATDLHGELVAHRDAPREPVPVNVRAVHDLLIRHDGLRERVKNQELLARRRARQLAARLRVLSDEGLLQFDPHAAGRCHGLLDAVPWTTKDWPLIVRQIDEAECLLARLEAQGRRLAALEIEAAYAKLTHAAPMDPAQARRVTHALAELQPYFAAQSLAPLALRARVQRLAERPEG